jgi:1,4-alpha-glucan branching enzyme
MSVTKEYINGKKQVCKVKFALPSVLNGDFKKASVVGDFNNWDAAQHPLRKRSNGMYTAIVELPSGSEYQFRYLLDENRWENEPEADRQEVTSFGDSHNSVVVI